MPISVIALMVISLDNDERMTNCFTDYFSLNARMSILLSLHSISISTLGFNRGVAFNEQINNPVFLSNSQVLSCVDLSILLRFVLTLKTVYFFF